MTDIQSAVAIAGEFRQELAVLDAAAVETMLRSWRDTEARLLERMTRLATQLEGQTPTPAQLLRMERMRDLFGQVQDELGRLETAVSPVIQAGQRQAVTNGALAAGEQLQALGATFNTLPRSAVENVISLSRAGRPLEALLRPMYGLATDGLLRELSSGLALGIGPREIARRMAQDGLTDGLNHLLLVTRDQYNRAHRTASLEVYRASEAVLGYVRRCARQPGRTCIACIALDGTFYEKEADFEEHPQGRCVTIPVVQGISRRGLNSGPEWFADLPQDTQIAAMGRERWEAWRSGELSWDGMVQRREHPVWGTSVTVRPIGRGE